MFWHEVPSLFVKASSRASSYVESGKPAGCSRIRAVRAKNASLGPATKSREAGVDEDVN